jgi:hypothetical protein
VDDFLSDETFRLIEPESFSKEESCVFILLYRFIVLLGTLPGAGFSTVFPDLSGLVASVSQSLCSPRFFINRLS